MAAAALGRHLEAIFQTLYQEAHIYHTIWLLQEAQESSIYRWENGRTKI